MDPRFLATIKTPVVVCVYRMYFSPNRLTEAALFKEFLRQNDFPVEVSLEYGRIRVATSCSEREAKQISEWCRAMF